MIGGKRVSCANLALQTSVALSIRVSGARVIVVVFDVVEPL